MYTTKIYYIQRVRVDEMTSANSAAKINHRLHHNKNANFGAIQARRQLRTQGGADIQNTRQIFLNSFPLLFRICFLVIFLIHMLITKQVFSYCLKTYPKPPLSYSHVWQQNHDAHLAYIIHLVDFLP